MDMAWNDSFIIHDLPSSFRKAQVSLENQTRSLSELNAVIIRHKLERYFEVSLLGGHFGLKYKERTAKRHGDKSIKSSKNSEKDDFTAWNWRIFKIKGKILLTPVDFSRGHNFYFKFPGQYRILINNKAFLNDFANALENTGAEGIFRLPTQKAMTDLNIDKSTKFL